MSNKEVDEVYGKQARFTLFWESENQLTE